MKKTTTLLLSGFLKICFGLLFLLLTSGEAQSQNCNAAFGHYSGSNPDSIHFYADSTNALSYSWTFGDSTTATGNYPWHVFPGPGTYHVCLIITYASDSCDWCDTVVVPQPTGCNAQFTHYSVHNPDSVHFYPSVTNAVSYYWSFGDNTFSTQEDPWHVYAGPGTYYSCLTIHTVHDSCTWCDSVVVLPPPPCNSSFVHYANTHNADSIHFYPNITNAVSYYWTFGDNTYSTNMDPWHLYSGPGTYTVCLTIHTQTDSCTSCDTVIIAPSNSCNAQWTNYNNSQNPDSVHVIATESGAISYYWNFGDSTTGTGQDAWHVFSGPGTYNVCLTVHDSSGYCTWCDTVIVPPSTACTASFTHYSIGGDSVRFHASPTTAIGYYWSWGDNTYLNTTITNPEHTYPGPGTYYACLTVYTTDTCTYCDTVIVAGNTSCNAQFGHYHLNNPDSIHFYPNTTGAISYFWNFGDGDTSNLQYPWHLFSGPGTYNVCLTVVDSSGHCTWCDTVIVPPPPTCNAEFVHYQIGNNPDSIHFYPYGTGALGYYWSFGDNTYSTILNPTHFYPGPGTYNVCLSVFYPHDTCTWCDTVVITGTSPCHAQFSHYTLSNPDSIHFYPTNTGALAYYWTFGDGDTSSLQYPWHYYAAPGTYVVCLTAYFSADTCTWCDSVVVGNTVCNTHFGHYTLSNPDSVHFYPTGNTAVSYHWDFGDGDTSNLQYPWHQFAASGTYYVCLTATYSTYTCTWCDSVTVHTSPNCDAQFSYYTLSNPDSVHYYPVVTGALGYYWSFGDSIYSTQVYPWHYYGAPGMYYVCLTAHFSSGYCTWCDSVAVDSANFFHRMADNPLLDKFYFDVNAVLVPELMPLNEGFIVYPNPVNDYVNVSIQRNTNAVDFRIYDANARIVYSSNLREGNYLVSMKEYAEGFYFYTAISEGRIIAKGKILIMR